MTAYIFSGQRIVQASFFVLSAKLPKGLNIFKAASVSAQSEGLPELHRQMLPPLRLPAFFCWAASSLLCKSVRHKSRRQLQQQARCPAFPITKTAHIGFSCVHHFPSCSSQNRCFSKSVRIPRTAHRRFCVPYPCTGSSTAIVVPFFELSSTRTQPPWRLAISHTKESPSPTPPYSRLRDLSTRKKG